MTVIAADPTAAIAAYLTAQIGQLLSVTPASGTGGHFQGPFGVPAVFRPDLPRGFDEQMPAACLVIRPAGGYQLYGTSDLPVGDTRIDVLCFAKSQLQSQNIGRAVVLALKALKPSEHEHTLLYWARLSGGGVLPLVDPETLWPCALVTAQVMHADVALA